MKEEQLRQFAASFADKIINQDYSAAHSLLAAWLQPVISAIAIKQFVETEVKEVAEGFSLEEEFHPRLFNISSNSCSLENLKEFRSYRTSRRSNQEIPPEVTTENFRKWMVIQFTPGLEDEIEVDAWFDWWMIVVEVDGEYRIGYFEIEDPD